MDLWLSPPIEVILFFYNFLRIPQSTSSTLIALSRVFAWTVVLKCFSFDTSLALLLPWLSAKPTACKAFCSSSLILSPVNLHCALQTCAWPVFFEEAYFHRFQKRERMGRENAVPEIVWLPNNLICNIFAGFLNEFNHTGLCFFFFSSSLFFHFYLYNSCN